MATIRLKLLETKRIAILNESNEEIFQGGNDELVIAGESNVTRITLDYDESIYGSYTFYADMINARGEGKQYLIGQSKNILLSDDMTYPGYTKIFISARKDEEIARWEKLNLRIWSTIPKYGNDPTKPNQPTVDIIPNIRFNASVDNNSGVPTVDVIKSGTLENPIFTLNFKNLRGSNLKPNGTATSTQILAFQEDKGIWVATDTGYWYYWNGTQYSEGGAFQSVEIEDGSVTKQKLGTDVLDIITDIHDKGIINEGRSKQNAIDIKTNQNHILFNSDRLNVLEAQINADKNTIEYTSDKQLEITCNGANIIDCNAHFKKIEGQTRRYSLNVFNVPSFDNAQWSYDSETCTISMKIQEYSEYILPTPFVIAKGTYTMLRTTSAKINTLFYDTEGGSHQISYFEPRKVFNFDKDITIYKIANNGEVKENYQITLVQGEVENDHKYYTAYDNTLVNSKATFVSSGRNMFKGGYLTKTPSGMTYTLKGTRLEVSGTPTGLAFDYLTNVTLPKGTYYIGKANMQGTIPGSNYIQINKGFQWFANEGKFTLNETTTLAICYTITTENVGKQINASFDIMLNVGSTLLPFEPYTESKSVINQELGAYDYIENGNLIKQTGKQVVLNGSEHWRIEEGSPTKRFINEEGLCPNARRYAYAKNLITNSAVLKDSTAGETWTDSVPGISLNANAIHICLSSVKTVEELKEWLKANPITLTYILETPTITPIVVPNGIVSYKNGLTSQEIKGKYLPYKYTAKYVNGGAE